jgi:hypothetical protein
MHPVVHHFLPDQALYHLKFPKNQTSNPDKKAWLATDKLPEFDMPHARSGRTEWVRINGEPARRSFLSHLGESGKKRSEKRRLLCFTASSGIGKSIALEQIAYLRTSDPVHVVIRYRFSELPLNAAHYRLCANEKSQLPNSTVKTLVDAFMRTYAGSEKAKGGGQGLMTIKERSVLLLLERKIASGHVTLIVDGMDELQDLSGGKQRATALRELLETMYTGLHCVVAGRPHAIAEDYWEELFAAEAPSGRSPTGNRLTSEWEFCLVAGFTDEQNKRYLGRKRHALLTELRSQASLTPRQLEVIRSLPRERIANLHSIACVYWEALTVSFQMDVAKREKGLLETLQKVVNEEQYIAYLSVLAYVTLESSPDLTTIKMSENVHSIHDRLKEVTSWRGISFSEFQERIQTIGKLNTSCIEFNYFRQIGEKISWKDRTVMEFFASLWLVRYSSVEQRRRAVSEIPRQGAGKIVHENRLELWAFLAGMKVLEEQEINPAQGTTSSTLEQYDDAPIEARWLELVQGLFGRFYDGKRPTHLMAIAWDNLERLRASGQSTQDARNHPTCESVMSGYLADYCSLRDSDPIASSVIAEDLESQLLAIEKPRLGWERAPIGHKSESDNPPGEVALDGPYRVCAYPVTKRLYRLFDPQHEQVHSKSIEQYCTYDRSPIIEVSWWDAKMFAIWSQSRLMTEWEWEYACRANSRDDDSGLSRYYWPNDHAGEKLKNHGWVHENSKKRTHPVGQKWPNRFQLHDMLGNVREWTQSSYPSERDFRVLRGGAFDGTRRFASVSVRFHYGPCYTDRYIGFRIART